MKGGCETMRLQKSLLCAAMLVVVACGDGGGSGSGDTNDAGPGGTPASGGSGGSAGGTGGSPGGSGGSVGGAGGSVGGSGGSVGGSGGSGGSVGGAGGSAGGAGGSVGGTGGAGGSAGGSGGNGGEGGAMCVAGERSCPCEAGDTCNPGLVCDRGFCVDEVERPDAGVCSPGAEGCACNPGNTCDDGLACVDAVCRVAAPPGDGLVPADALARGCEVLFQELAGPVARVRFADGVVGEFTRRDGKAALAFVTPGAQVDSAATIELVGGALAGAGTLRRLSSTCYDQNGRALPGEGVLWD